METPVKAVYRKIIFHAVKVPLMFFLITVGFIIEFLLNLPFILMTVIDDVLRKKT